MSADPIVVYGPLRGGTTMIRLMLDGHPDLTVPGETDFLFDHLHRDGDGWRYEVDDLKSSRIFQDSGLAVPHGPNGQAALLDLVGQIAESGGGRPVLMLHRHLSEAATLLPGVRIIRLLRDPRDVARSAIGMGWAGNVYYGLDTWLETEKNWRDFIAASPDTPVHVLRYEDLVRNPEAELRRICAFLGIGFTEDLLAYPARTTYAAPDPKLASQWKRKLSDREVRLIESRLDPFWQDSGYEPSGLPVHRPDVSELMMLRMQNRAAVWKHMVGRYGPMLPVIRGLGRRLRLSGLKQAADKRIADIDRSYLK
ncbi:sulfotransferase [Paracoccus subflavus]|uniref:Sulfotransferase n=1 Tax=Paracoccus subflavus TaxID=2528244 RepID=A0A4Q9G201_9RHOB|nr:sulfotransferase [Paracoccus subflavus]TBN41792.1 sulfotransferase [Paracoccus subflavus]